MAEDMRGKIDDLSSNSWPADYSCFSLLNVPIKEFDLITAFQTHFHWSDLTQDFLELKRILKPDGIILLACEWSKLAYYLPDFRKQEKLEYYLSNLDLHLIDSQRKDQWILYKIVKK